MKSVQKSILLPWDKYQRLIKQRCLDVNESSKTGIHPLGCVSLSHKDIIASLPSRYAARAETILNYIVRDPKTIMSWNNKG